MLIENSVIKHTSLRHYRGVVCYIRDVVRWLLATDRRSRQLKPPSARPAIVVFWRTTAAIARSRKLFYPETIAIAKLPRRRSARKLVTAPYNRIKHQWGTSRPWGIMGEL